MYNARIDAVKHLLSRFLDFYNEWGLLIVQIVVERADLSTIITILFGALSISFANGGRSPPAITPGSGWWGSGRQLDEDGWRMGGGSYTDGMFKASLPYLLTSLLNLTILGNKEALEGYEEIIAFALAEAYLCCFAFALICICENTFREDDKPLGELRKEHPCIGRIVVTICQLLTATIPVCINVSLVSRRAAARHHSATTPINHVLE
jgi:hypothetical protein|uniref:Uncharacterized protein n=1 Tax=Florenciella parvula TaxID=236787 RepID=A0A7S2FSX7_9STRA|mmetsp:Transcript_21757/g.45386  ORF Transcript_21757/g.45386 Transcript_21757/m.45386 type:complete len:208 (+) Transcript_21757:265-888(+)|eukprot:CAMPEP_0182534900 /NCGR_PEP_ID=MMETSP1323-20130603/16578_1 /TAXON_ID=236787 /ORGANISM="Florenciella parvula, Strain RCC1693" /LENGTH=207 /DNA_ID=CAMNT_0024744965 /DNA_START=258 /DNA_END=881 /DNA_ORIENTATION=+